MFSLNSILSKNSFLFRFIILGILSICFCDTNVNAQYFVDPNTVFVKSFDGWGTSMAWWPDVLGHMSDDVVQKITNLFFSPDELNFNIVRYTIGGTTPMNYTCGSYRPGGATESYRDSLDTPYDWSRDPRQRRILQEAKNLGVGIFEAFSNSPPQWMTISGCSKGISTGAPLYVNFLPENADLFTDYATDVLLHFRDVWNITFTYYAPFNEPFGDDGNGWWTGPAQNQEGCHMPRSTMVSIIRSLSQALQAKNLTEIQISVADETQINTEVASQIYFANEGINNLYHKVSTHGYWDDGNKRRDLLHMLSQQGGHTLWMDEMGWSGTPANNMQQGLYIANRIVWDLRDMTPSAWVYWQAMETIGGWGLVNIPYNYDVSVDEIVYNSGFYSMKQFSKFIRKGFSIIHSTDENSVAAFDASNNILVMVIVNGDSTSMPKQYDLTQFQTLGNITATRTSSSEQNINIESPLIDSFYLDYTAPSQSVTTIIIENAIPSIKINLIRNGDFESGILQPWSLYYGSDGGVSQNYAWNGNFSGLLAPSESDLSLNQVVIAPYTSTYHLSARCVSNNGTARLGVRVNGAQGPELNIENNIGYKIYGISFAANQNDLIDVYFYASRNSSDVYIDDVVLH